MKKPISIILDGDPGHDDAISWVVANASKDLKILAVTAVNGNCNVFKAAYNSQRICALIGLDVPIAKGKNCPLYRASLQAPTNVHGESGLDGPALPEPVRELEKMGAVQLMHKVINENDDKVTIVATGPLTNVAELLLAYPEDKAKIENISIMGGGIYFGNWTPAAEFNILIDPEAADIVFKSGIHVIMSGLDVTEKALVIAQDVENIKQIGNPVSEIVWKWLEFFYQFHFKLGYPGAPMHDLCAVMALIHPEIFKMEELYVEVEVGSQYCDGATIGDVNHITGKPVNATCLLDVDRERFNELLVEYIKTYSEVH